MTAVERLYKLTNHFKTFYTFETQTDVDCALTDDKHFYVPKLDLSVSTS